MCSTLSSDEDAGCGTDAADATRSEARKDAVATDTKPPAKFVDEFVDVAAGEDAAGKDGKPPVEFQWKQQMETLREMGLADGVDGVTEWELVQLLEKHLGSLDRVVDSLIQKKTDMV